MKNRLFLDIETFSDVDIRAGVYQYAASPLFDIILLSYAFGENPVQVVNVIEDGLPPDVEAVILSNDVIKVAHNAAFERVCFSEYLGHKYLDPAAWECTLARATYNGYPDSLDRVSKAMKLHDGKAAGGLLIKYFCVPCKPIVKNGGRVRNLPCHDPKKWAEFRAYAKRDTEVCREVWRNTDPLPKSEAEMYAISERINDRGIGIDVKMVRQAIAMSDESDIKAKARAAKVGVPNPNSVAALKRLLLIHCGLVEDSLNATRVEELLSQGNLPHVVRVALEARVELSKASIKKYLRMMQYAGKDNRARGVHQFYGASRTGRWSGRGIQAQNLPQTHIDVEEAKRLFMKNPKSLSMFYTSVPDVLSQLIRTAIIPLDAENLCVCDFSSIEARVLAWMANETWVIECMKGDGKIYEEMGARMFGVPKAEITKGSELRQQSKIATLACGYGGSIKAFEGMAESLGIDLGMTEAQIRSVVTAYRAANPNIVRFWKLAENNARVCVAKHLETWLPIGPPDSGVFIQFNMGIDGALRITLPSGRALYYRDAHIAMNKFNEPAIHYREQKHGRWDSSETYSGKLVENLTQAIARDLLANGLRNAYYAGLDIIMHVHDEIVVEERNPGDGERLKACMLDKPAWTVGLPLDADGFETPFYKK